MPAEQEYKVPTYDDSSFSDISRFSEVLMRVFPKKSSIRAATREQLPVAHECISNPEYIAEHSRSLLLISQQQGDTMLNKEQ